MTLVNPTIINPQKRKSSFVNLWVIGQLKLKVADNYNYQTEDFKFASLEAWGIECNSLGRFPIGVNEYNGELKSISLEFSNIDRYAVKRLDRCHVIVLIYKCAVNTRIELKRVNLFIPNSDVVIMLVSNLIYGMGICKI